MKKTEIYFFWGTKSPGLLPGLRPWTPLGETRPVQTPYASSVLQPWLYTRNDGITAFATALAHQCIAM